MEKYQRATWRVIEHSPQSGPWNMAVDEAILESVFTGDSAPTLRLYAWEPACLSLGHAQPFSEVNEHTLIDQGWDVVRRPTGGRAILHVDELTYSVIAPESEPRVQGGVLDSYLQLSEALLQALRILGLNPHAQQQNTSNPGGKPNPVCFEVPSNYEITVNGKKLIGSAQARRKEGILQHGALPLYGDLSRIITVLQFPDDSAQMQAKMSLLAHATTIENELGIAFDWQDASDAFQCAFKDKLNLDLLQGSLTENEIRRAQQLVEQKYANPTWTKRI